MTMGIKELRDRLLKAGLMVDLDKQRAERLREVASRERIVRALERVESGNDTGNGAWQFLEKSLKEVGAIRVSEQQTVPEGNTGQAQDGQTGQPPAASEHERAPETGNRQQQPSESSGTTASNETRGGSEAPLRRIQHHVYGKKAALTFELDDNKKGVPTVALDGASASAERQYDWKNKIRVQFTQDEIPAVAAVLLGISDQCEYSNHGPDNNKGFSIAWQSERSSFFISMWQGKGNSRAVPMGREDAFYAAQVLICAIQKASSAALDVGGIMMMLKATQGRK